MLGVQGDAVLEHSSHEGVGYEADRLSVAAARPKRSEPVALAPRDLVVKKGHLQSESAHGKHRLRQSKREVAGCPIAKN